MYWASGCLHGPHHIMKVGRQSTPASSTTAGTPTATACTPAPRKGAGSRRIASSPSATSRWRRGTTSPTTSKPFQRRLMEVAAGFGEHVDVQVGRLNDELEALGYADNTLFVYIWGDNGSSGEGQNGTISELLAQNGIPTTVPAYRCARRTRWSRCAGLAARGQPVQRRVGVGGQRRTRA